MFILKIWMTVMMWQEENQTIEVRSYKSDRDDAVSDNVL